VSPVPLVSIVDDDVSMREAISLVLRWHGFRTQNFESAEAFLNRAPNHEACMIIDVQLPGIDGLELQRRLSEAPASPPVIVVSAHADDRARHRALDAGAVAFLRKPFTDDQLVQSVEHALGAEPADDASSDQPA